MARRALAASFVLAPLAVVFVAQGCTQDFSTFDVTGSGGSGPSVGSTSSGGTPTSSSSSGSPTTTTTSTNVGPGGGGGEGGAPSGPVGPGGAGGEGGTGGDGGAGGQGGGTGGEGGVQIECTNPGQCNDQNPCTDDGCVDGQCVNTPVPDDVLDPDDQDCRTITCEGGEVVDVPNDGEDPDDPSPPCFTRECQGGEPTDVFADAGTSCGDDPLECDGAGVCVGCDPDGPDAQCGDPTECSSPVCNDDGSCDQGFLPDTTPLTDEDPGDCMAPECTGDAELSVLVADDTDTPADLPCGVGDCNAGLPEFDVVTEGDACIGQTGVCDGAGTAAANCRNCRDTEAGSTIDAGCDAANPVCNEAASGGDGQCVDCIDTTAGAGVDDGCSVAAPICDGGTCVECLDDASGSDTDTGCPANEVCNDAGTPACVPCLDTDTNGGSFDDGCEGVTPACNTAPTPDVCVECTDNDDCIIPGFESPSGELCNRNGGTQCGCTTSGNPDPGCIGHPAGATCTANPGVCSCQNSTECTNSAYGDDCLTTVTPNVCGCDNDDDCGTAGGTCSAGVCTG